MLEEFSERSQGGDISIYVLNITWLISLVGRVFANGTGDPDSILGRVIPKTKKKKKRVLDTSFLNTQHYKVRIKGKMYQSREMCCILSHTSVL